MAQTAVLYRLAAVRDALGTDFRSAAVEVCHGRVVAVGPADDLTAASGARVVDLPDVLLLPLLTNAHAHLDLTGRGRQPYGGDFVGWLGSVMRDARGGEIQAAVGEGLEASRRAGVGYVGDIVHHAESLCQHRAGPLAGVSYLECFGIGVGQGEAAAHLRRQITTALANPIHASAGSAAETTHDKSGTGMVLGIGPHAPYSVGIDLYEAATNLAVQHGLSLTTHLAETEEELRFVRQAAGPFVDLLKSLGKWDATIKPTGQHPVEWLEPLLARGGDRWLLAHCNYVEDRHLEILARCGASVVYCPVASDYFGHHRPERGQVHRYRDMIDAGINVCLGTDSIVCQQPGDPDPAGIGSQMRYLYRRDRTDPALLLAMATVNGMRALGLAGTRASIRPGAAARWVAVRVDPDDPTPPLTQALGSDEPMSLFDPAVSSTPWDD